MTVRLVRGIGALRSLRWAAGMVGMVGIAGGGLYLARAATVTRPTLTFAGTLTQNGSGSAPATLMFQFKKGGSVLCSPQVSVSPAADGAFQTQVPINGCPGDLFDGQDVLVDVSVGGVRVASDQPVSPVPYAKYADRAGTAERASVADRVDALTEPDCPIGYVKAAELPNPSNPSSVLCRKGADEVVKVGSGATAFWIDRYEATVTERPDGSGTPNAVAMIPVNGQWQLNGSRAYALSRAGVSPEARLTWFQADVACAFSGKRLPTNWEWQRAAVGTVDPGNNSADGPCFTVGTQRRLTGRGGQCVSHWGAQDMIGNQWEWTNDWTSAAGSGTTPAVWPNSLYNADSVYAPRLPTAFLRGGGYLIGAEAGVFALWADPSPAGVDVPWIGFRCVIPR